MQFAFPGILTTLERNRGQLLDGQVWRLVSPLFVQDGGVAGTIFNLITLVLLGGLAVILLGWRHWLFLYFGTGIASEVVAYTLIQQGEAGNSIANFGVAAGLVVVAMRPPQMPCAAAGGIGLLAGLTLLAVGNLHGAAFTIDLVLTGILMLKTPHHRLAIPTKTD